MGSCKLGRADMHSKGFRVKLLGLAFVAIALPFVTNEWFGEWFHTNNIWYLRLFHPEYWYSQFAPGRPIQSQIDDIRIVTIAKDVEPGNALGENRCTHRKFMAALLNKLATVHPTLIVIDKWYNAIPEGACPADDDSTGAVHDGTTLLKNALWNLTTKSKVKVVIAVQSFTRAEANQNCDPHETRSLKDDQVVLAKYENLLGFSPLSGDNVVSEDSSGAVLHPYWGLALINSDIRKIPLGWSAFEDCKNVAPSGASLVATLSTAAATLMDETTMKRHNLAELERNVTHPYTKLVLEKGEEGGFKSVSAIGLICDKARDSNWEKCAPTEGNHTDLDSLEGRKIVIGETRKDSFAAEGEVIEGPALQANYIASLLSENELRPVDPWVNHGIGFVWLGLIFWFYYWGFKKSPLLAAMVSLLSTIALGLFFSGVVTRQFGFFIDVVPPTLLEIVGLYLARNIEHLLEHDKEPEREPGR